MAEISSPIELGFTEFVGKLITDTFEAVLNSQVTQEEQWVQLEETLQLEPKEFAEQVIDDELLEERLSQIFPDEENNHAIYKGKKYLKGNPSQNKIEQPQIYAFTGYRPSGRSLTEKDINSIKDAVRMQMAGRQREILSKIIQQGATKVVVDGGKINAKLTFSINQIQEDNNEDEEERGNTNNDENSGGFRFKKLYLKNRNFLFNRTIPQPLQKVRFFVKPTSEQNPQSAQTKANIYSEVEIDFKTIS